MGSWFRTHREKIVTHTAIIAVFVLLTIFVAEPLLDRLERIPGEAQLYQFQLPAETNNILFSVGDIIIHSNTIEISGWALIEEYYVDSTYIVLKSDRHTYIFDTARRELGEWGWLGFITNIPLRKIANGEYIVGLYLTKGDIQALKYTDDAIVKAGDIAELTVRMSKMQEIPLPLGTSGVTLQVDTCEVVNMEMDIAGWAFIEGQGAENSTIYVVLKSGTATYIFDTISQRRPDVTAFYVESGLNLDNSGFIARIPADTVEEGTYRLGIYIKKGDVEALQYTGSVIKF